MNHLRATGASCLATKSPLIEPRAFNIFWLMLLLSLAFRVWRTVQPHQLFQDRRNLQQRTIGQHAQADGARRLPVSRDRPAMPTPWLANEGHANPGLQLNRSQRRNVMIDPAKVGWQPR